MKRSYAETRIREALQQAGGNTAQAKKLLTSWVSQDHKLLLELTRNHLGGIIAYNVERVASGRAVQKQSPPAQKQSRKKPEKPDMDPFGKELLKAVTSKNAGVFGMEAYSTPPGKGKASQRHINAIRQIAARSKTEWP